MASNPRPVCPLDLEVGATYTDTDDGHTFTVAAITIRGVAARVSDTTGHIFTVGGLYRGLVPAAA